MMGGDVPVTSEGGKGSVFTVRLPSSGVTQDQNSDKVSAVGVNKCLLRIVELT